MKKIATFFLLFIIAGVSLSSCKKDLGRNSSGDEYMEFKIDGVLYHMNQYQNSPTDFTVVTATHHGPNYGKYSLTNAAAHSPGDEGAGIIVIDNNPIMANNYTLSLQNGEVFTYVTPDGRQFMSSASSAASINFNSIDTTMGHPVEGSFQVNNLDLLNEDGDIISSGHTLTQGSFKTKVK